MKNKSFSKIYLTLLFLIIFSIKTNGQWLVGNFLGNFWGETDPANRIDAIGIGDYTGNTNQPAAALDITIPYLFNQGAMLANQGEAIRSSVAPNFDHTWKMFTFNNPLVEKFRILNIGNLNLTTYQAFDGAASVNDIHLNLIPKGNMNFFTENKLWMRLREIGNLGLSNDWTTFSPVSLFHLNQKDNTNLFAQWTNGNTGLSVNDGLKIGIEYNGGYSGANKSFAKIIQQEDAPMKFYTNNTDRMIINAAYNPTIHSQVVNTTGYVGMGANNFWGEESGGEGPRSLLHLQGPYNAFANGGNGWRTWNQTGMYINENSDEMYIGLKNEFTLNGPTEVMRL